MNKFKIGDRVRVVKLEEAINSQWYVVGNVGKVTGRGLAGVVVVTFDADASGNVDYWFVNESELEAE